VSVREINSAVLSDRTVHRAERVPNWRSLGETPPWRALCGVSVGRTRAGGSFEFSVAVALDPQAWRLAANCSACLAVTESRELGSLS
jgi:hypothetical protein